MRPQEVTTPTSSSPLPLTLGLGLGLGFPLLLVLSCSRSLKPLAAATSAAAAALKAPKVFSSGSSPLLSLLVASKAASKSYKAARLLRPSSPLPSLPSSKRIKAALAAASLLRLAAAATPPPNTGLAALALLKSSYKLSKNSAKVLEGFLGLQIHRGIRNGVDALGVVVKVAMIATEVAVWIGMRWRGGRDDRCCRFGFDRHGSVALRCQRFDDGIVIRDRRRVEVEGEGFGSERCAPSQLLCLAVPVPEMALLS